MRGATPVSVPHASSSRLPSFPLFFTFVIVSSLLIACARTPDVGCAPVPVCEGKEQDQSFCNAERSELHRCAIDQNGCLRDSIRFCNCVANEYTASCSIASD